MVAGTVHMDLKKKVTISWSGGKDSAFALFKVLRSGNYEVRGLHTVINSETKRVGMHGVREELIERQAESLGLPLQKLYLDSSESHDQYTTLMRDYYQQCARENFDAVVFGDIFLEDLKAFRDGLLQSAGLRGLYPLWETNTKQLAEEFIIEGFKTLICSANAKHFTRAHMGTLLDVAFLKTLASDVDPCGENGEFHTFVYDGPVFKKSVDFERGEIVRKVYSYQKVDADGRVEKLETAFLFQDFLPSIAR
jgi:uncharacterized protein (TIGR00290 family)